MNKSERSANAIDKTQRRRSTGGTLGPLGRRRRLLLLAGLAVIAIAAGAVTGVRLLAGPSTPTPSPAPVVPPPVQPTVDAPVPSPTGAEPTAVTASPSDESFESPSGSPEPAPGATTYLDSQPETAGDYRARPVAFGDVRYPRGISVYCQSATTTYVQWNVAGSSTFVATAGVDDAAEGAFGEIAEMTFYDEDSRRLTAKPVEVSVGHSKQVKIDLTGVVSLRMTCAARVAETNESATLYAALGDPYLIRG